MSVKRLALILFSSVLLAATPSVRASYTLNVTDNFTLCLNGDSNLRDGDIDTSSTADQVGCLVADEIAAGIDILNPFKTNVNTWNLGSSGSLMTGQATVIADQNYAIYAHNLFHGYNTNDIRNVGFELATANGVETSNQMFLSLSNNLLALATTTNSVGNTNEGGSSASNHVDWVTFMEHAPINANGGGTAAQSDFDRMTGATNAGATFGAGFINCFDRTLQPITNYYNAGDNPPLEIQSGAKAGHDRALGSHIFADSIWMEILGTDTNIFNVTVDYNAASIVTTNHSVITSISKSGNALTFQVTFLRMSPGFDVSGTVDWLGNVTTNDASYFTQVWPAAGNFFQETFAAQNLPAGNWKLLENGTLIKQFTMASPGTWTWNMATNYLGPRWQQKAEVLARARDIENADRVTHLVSSGAGLPRMGSLAAAQFPTHHGDDLVTNVNGSAGVSMDQVISGIKTNATKSFKAMSAAAYPTNYTYQIVPATVFFAPFHR